MEGGNFKRRSANAGWLFFAAASFLLSLISLAPETTSGMLETLLSRYRREFPLCSACDNACHIEPDLPPPGSENPILRTGRFLSRAEKERIGQTIVQTDECLEELGAKVKDLMALVAQLRDGERELKERRKVQQACLAPVRKLPLEILSIIFKMYRGDGVVDISQKRCPPLRLSAVCKVWRDTMLGMHSLWNAFEIPYIHGVETRVILTRLRAFLDYSGDLPLQHCLLLEHAHRWTDIRFVPSYGRVSDDQREMLRKLEGRQLSRLRKLDGNVSVLAACNTIGILTGLTSLRSVTMHDALHHLERMTGTPWEQIEELDTLLPCGYALAYLQRCPNLVAWSYQDSSQRAELEVHPPASSIVLPRLQRLSIHIRFSADTAILHSITTPALGKLSLSSSPRINSDWDHLSVSGFTSLLGRSSCHLRRLFLIYAPRGILEALYGPSLQGLTTLGIRADNDAPLTKAFIGSLCIAHTDGTPRLLPFLENLEFGGEPEGFKASTLVTMAEARRAMGRPLKRFLLDAALMGMSDLDFGWTYESEGQMCQVVDEVEVRGRNYITG